MFRIRAILYDVARGLKSDPVILQNIVKRLSKYGYNMLMLNLEYRFRYPSHPDIGLPDSLTPEDIKNLDKFANELGVELVPFINCAGHCSGIGMLEKYKQFTVDPSGLGDGIEQLRVSEPAAMQLMTDLYNDIFDCFSSKYFHIGADEIRQLDKQFPDLTPEKRWDKALDHVLYFIQLVKEKGKIPMMWGDMLLLNKWSIDRVPDDVIVCDWAAFSDPLIKQLSNVKTQTFFKEAGKATAINPSVNVYFGNPVLSINSTLNIVSFTKEHKEIFGEKANGVILSMWEAYWGAFFSCAWPWIYLQSKLFRDDFEGTDINSMGFLREYTKMEWGLDDDSLKEWYELIDRQFQKFMLYEGFINESARKSLQEVSNRSYSLLRRLVKDLFSSENILPKLNNARSSWMSSNIRIEFKKILSSADKIALHMYESSIENKQEPLRLLQFNRVLLAVCSLVDLENEIELLYSEAANLQGFENDNECKKAFTENAEKIASNLNKMADVMLVLNSWAQVLTDEEDYSGDEVWWTGRACEELKKRAKLLSELTYDKCSLICYSRYIRLYPEIPASRITHPTGRALAK